MFSLIKYLVWILFYFIEHVFESLYVFLNFIEYVPKYFRLFNNLLSAYYSIVKLLKCISFF